MEKHPESTIICIDSLNASIGIGMLAIEAAKMAKEGATPQQIEEKIVSIRKKVNQYVTVHSLDAFRRAGRIGGSAAFFGNLIGIKPILISDAEGTQIAYRKVKGRKKSFNEIVSMLKESIIDPENQTIYVAHADCDKEEVELITSIIKSEINCKDVSVGYIGPTVGASIGNDAIGIWGFGEEITFKSEK